MNAFPYEATGELSATIIRANGTIEDVGILSASEIDLDGVFKRFAIATQRKLMAIGNTLLNRPMALVTNAGFGLVATNFTSSSTALTTFTYADWGTGTTTPTAGDTTLTTPVGTSRVSGTNSNPSSLVFKNIATITATGTVAVTEYGLFNAATAGTLWDHRTFSALNLSSGDGCQFTYLCTFSGGGS